VDKYFSEQRNRQWREAGFSLIDMEQAFPWIESLAWRGEPFLGLMLVHDGAKARSELGLADFSGDAGPASVVLEDLVHEWERRKGEGERITAAEVGQVLRSDQAGRLSEALTNRLHALLIGPENGKGLAKPASKRANGSNDGDLAEVIKRCLADILDLAEVEEARSFQDYGMNSISGMRFALLLEKRLKLPVLPQALIEHHSVRALAAHLASAEEARGENVTGGAA
jgi:hypothetical protein